MALTEQKVSPKSPRVFDIPTLLFLFAGFIFLYPFLFAPHFIPIDRDVCNSAYVSDAYRMYQGDVMYRDFFQFSPPATALVYFFLFKLFGLQPWIINLENMLLGLSLAWLGVIIAKKVTHPNLALLPSAIFLAELYKGFLEPTHHWYSLLAACGGIAVLIERRTPARIAAAGFFGALSACFTQMRGVGVILGFAVFICWESRRKQEDWRALLKKEAWLLASFLGTLIALNGYFIWQAGLRRFLWCTVVFGIKCYPKDAEWNTFRVFSLGLPKFVTLRGFIYQCGEWLFVNGIMPATAILFFARYGRDRGKKPIEFWERPMLLAVVGASMFLGIAAAPALHRLAACAFPGLLLLGWFLDSPGKLARVLKILLPVGVLVIALHGMFKAESPHRWTFTTRQGNLALEDWKRYEGFAWVQQHTRPKEYFYDAADEYWVGEYCLDLRNPTPLSIIKNNGYTTPEQVAEVIQGLERHHVHYVAWSPPELDVIPAWENPSEDPLGPLRDYLHSHYQLVKVLANADQIWERKD
jgi:hypothetical protein